ncbi:MAG: phage Gp37/Gp68 family protein [Magnetovibrionaceae bacterium]
MAENTKIEWATHTFNGWTGCTPVSPGCDYCYAESWAKRSGQVKWGAGEARRRTTETNWKKPLKWNAMAEGSAERPRIFCNSLSDMFDSQVQIQWLYDQLDLIEATPNLDWLAVTKRINRAAALAQFGHRPWPANLWIGVSVEIPLYMEPRLRDLMKIPAPVRFLSIEPLLEPVRLPDAGPFPDWVIVGGESGSDRPMDPDWARDLRDDCRWHGIPFFMKQMAKKAEIPADLMVREFPTPVQRGCNG